MKTYWSHSVGEKGRNRVRVYQRARTRAFAIDWHENGRRVRVSVDALVRRRVRNHSEAIAIAEAKSLELLGFQSDVLTTAGPVSEDAWRELATRHDGDLLAARIQVEPVSGVYFLLYRDAVVYVGQSVDVVSRIAAHRVRPPAIFDGAAALALPSGMLDRAEAFFIQRFRPQGNRTSPIVDRRDVALISEVEAFPNLLDPHPQESPR